MLAVVLAACSSNPATPPPPTIPPATPASSPPQADKPVGVVRPLPGAVLAAAVDATTSSLVVLMAPDAHQRVFVAVFAPGQYRPRVIPLPTQASAMAATGDGEVLLTIRGGYLVVDVAAGTARQVDVADQRDTDFTAIARRVDGKLVLGSADGTVFIVDSDGSVSSRQKIFARVDSVVTQGDTAVVLDRGQTSVTALDADGEAQQALRAGEGATSMVVDPAGRLLVTDTRGDELLVFSVDPLIMRQRYPVPAAPYGLAGSKALAWVSQTAANVVVGYDLATGIPVEKVRYKTVQQPDSLAFDTATDTLYVVSGAGAGVQVIENAGSPQ